jgi:hypothetical protein
MYGNDAAKQATAPSYGAAEAPRQPELAEQVNRLEKALCFAEESLSELGARLSGVLRPPAPEPVAAGNQLTAVGPSTHYGGQVHDFVRRTNNVGERAQDLLRRLEA